VENYDGCKLLRASSTIWVRVRVLVLNATFNNISVISMIIKEMFYIPIKLKPELARASMTTSDVNNQWRSNFQQQII
jgi:hypothetical protein